MTGRAPSPLQVSGRAAHCVTPNYALERSVKSWAVGAASKQPLRSLGTCTRRRKYESILEIPDDTSHGWTGYCRPSIGQLCKRCGSRNTAQ
jgi:hypothetical protein